MHDIGWSIAQVTDEEVSVAPRSGDPSGVDWFGEVTNVGGFELLGRRLICYSCKRMA